MPLLGPQKAKAQLVYNQPRLEQYAALIQLQDTVNQCIRIRDFIQKKIKEGAFQLDSHNLQDLMLLEAVIQ